ncbi:zinc finger and SCAN domain-containing protein 2-like [Trichogramma pretiosum]|uniref:C2H2-type domain-containing protein n=1 Tax=Trichogramma kaykai TaxID=54128 RepID=A0ABD2W854_9HYME|nr:zinc finger and SCAN domain-containing protein 2-like [Trichogramma pretiosum]
MASMFEQQIKSEPMGFYSVASSRSDGSSSIVNLSDDREELSQQDSHVQQLQAPHARQVHHQQLPHHPDQEPEQLAVLQQASHSPIIHHEDSPGRHSTVDGQPIKEGSRSKPQPCKVCGKVLSSASSYYVHMKLHSGHKPYHCTVCEASFCRKPYLEVHMRTHTGERPFQCELCLKRFTQKSSLNTHKRVHTGERPYSCDICNKRFAVKSYVTAHRWSHVAEKPLVCERCSLTFTSKSQFAVHIRTHTASTTYECNICGRTFVRDSYLIRHQNRVHRGGANSGAGSANTSHEPGTPQSSGAGTPGATGFESPVCDLRYSDGPSSLDGLAQAAAGKGNPAIAAEIAASIAAKQNSLQLPLPLLHPQSTN